MRELVMKYKAEKVCHEEMVKMPLVDLKVLEDGSFRICMDYRKFSEIAIRNRCHQMRVHEEEIPKTDFRTRLHEVKGGARVAFEDEFRAAEEREVLCEAQQGRSGVKRKLFRSFRNKIGDVRTLIMDEAHVTKYYVRPEAEIGESKMVGLEMEQKMTKVVVIKERLKEAKYHQERVKLIVGNQTFRIWCCKISIVKVRWNSKHGPEFTWEREDYMKASYGCSDSLLLTSLCCDDIYDVTPRVSALAGCDIIDGKTLVISTLYYMRLVSIVFNRSSMSLCIVTMTTG
nr:putative reverse transcriptase domain, ribonuclease H-like domain, aspartic peptidase domain protein [Tanacetum cinerariifolium]